MNHTDERQGWTSASNAEADSLCPGRHIAQRGQPETTSDDAEHGRLIHDALARRDPSKLIVEQRDIYESCLAIEDRKGREFFGVKWDAVKTKPMVEQRLWAQFKENATGQVVRHSCRVDRVYRDGLRFLVIEYKTLASDIPSSSRNLQLRDQIVIIRGNAILVEAIGAVVIQPLVTHNPEICLYHKEDIDRSMVEMRERIFKSNDPRAPRVPGDLQCKFCRAKAVCREYQQWAGSKLPVPVSILDVPMSEWTPEQCVIFLDGYGVAEKWLLAGWSECVRRLKADPNAIPGNVLTDGVRREKITDPQTCFERAENLGVDLENFLQCVTVGKTALKERIAVATGTKGKALEAHMKQLTAGISEEKQTEGTIKKVTQ